MKIFCHDCPLLLYIIFIYLGDLKWLLNTNDFFYYKCNTYRINKSQIQEEKNKVNYNKKKGVRVLDYKI